jgi:hypothetical protein
VADAKAQTPRVLGRRGWKSGSNLDLSGVEAEELSNYIGKLCSNCIRLSNDDEDSLCWSKNPRSGEFIVKLGYNVQAKAQFTGERNGDERLSGRFMDH